MQGCILESQRLTTQYIQELVDVGGDDLVGLFEQITVGRIYDIGARQSVVNPLALVAERLADGTRECHYVVARLLFDLAYAVYIERRVAPQLLDILGRDHAQRAPRLRGEYLDFEVCVELVLSVHTRRMASRLYLSIMAGVVYLSMRLRKHSTVFSIRHAIVIGPTPPGVLVM